MGKMICTKEAREACDLAYMCEENAEVMGDSECADLIVKMEAVKWERKPSMCAPTACAESVQEMNVQIIIAQG